MKKVHFMGIGGSGISAIAAIAQAQGYQVTGCDKNPHNEFTTHLQPEQLLTGHSADHLSHLRGGDILAISPAIPSLDPNNPELIKAKEMGIEVLTWQQFMGKYLEEDKFVIAVCGTHGKSTTTAMIGLILEEAGLDPTVELGAIVPHWKANYRIGQSKYFVSEADEFNNNFLVTTPDIAVVTNVEMDHPEFFKDLEDYKASFDEFLSKTKGSIVANMSDLNVGDVIKYVIKQTGKYVVDYSKSDFNLDLKIPGKFNLLNAQAAFQVGLALGIDPAVIRKALNNFTGIERRFELIGEYKGGQIYSDFAHHPTELKVNLEAAREKFKNQKIWVIFQPHMFSRTHALFQDFVQVLTDAPVDGIAIMDIYPSREVDTGLVTSEQLVKAINKPTVEYSTIAKMHDFLKSSPADSLKDNVLIFMGAGDTDKWAKQLVNDVQPDQKNS